MNSSPDLLKSSKTNNEVKPKGFTQCLLYQLFQETNSQIIVQIILKGKKSHESKANEGRDTQMATRVSKSARVTTTCLVNTSCKKDKKCTSAGVILLAPGLPSLLVNRA